MPMQTVIDRVEENVLVPTRLTVNEKFGLRIGGSADELASTERSLATQLSFML